MKEEILRQIIIIILCTWVVIGYISLFACRYYRDKIKESTEDIKYTDRYKFWSKLNGYLTLSYDQEE